MKGTLQPFCSKTVFSPPPPPSGRGRARSPEPEFFPADGTPFEERELVDVCSLMDNKDLVETERFVDTPKPFAGFGSYRQIHRDRNHGRWNVCGSCLSAEAPAKLECSTMKPSCADSKVCRKLGKQRSFPSDIDREEAWERKRELYVADGLSNQRVHSGGETARRAVARSVSDCGERTWPVDKPLGKVRTRSLTDEDLEELRGCIDLGFGFSPDEDCDLLSTLPALELYYAINRQYLESKSRLSPVSPFEEVSMLYTTSTDDGPGSPLSESWRISSPGDTPSQVKTRLRHWAQAVACSVKQGVSL